DRVEPGGGLIEEQKRRVESQRAGKPGAFDHSAREFGREFGPGIGRQPDHRDLVGGDLVEQPLIESWIIFAKRDLDIFSDAQRRKERAALKHHAPATAQVTRFLFIGDGVERLAVNLDFACGRGLQSDDRTHQHRLSGARTPDDAQYLARAHVEVEMVVDYRVAKLVDESAYADRDVEFLGPHRVSGRKFLPDFVLLIALGHQFHPIEEKKTAKKASRTMTRKIA